MLLTELPVLVESHNQPPINLSNDVRLKAYVVPADNYRGGQPWRHAFRGASDKTRSGLAVVG
jgi:hypothetical protein